MLKGADSEAHPNTFQKFAPQYRITWREGFHLFLLLPLYGIYITLWITIRLFRKTGFVKCSYFALNIFLTWTFSLETVRKITQCT